VDHNDWGCFCSERDKVWPADVHTIGMNEQLDRSSSQPPVLHEPHFPSLNSRIALKKTSTYSPCCCSKSGIFIRCAISQPSHTQERYCFIQAWVLSEFSTNQAHPMPASSLHLYIKLMHILSI